MTTPKECKGKSGKALERCKIGHKTTPQIEKAAITMLVREKDITPELERWINNIAKDPTYTKNINQNKLDSELEQIKEYDGNKEYLFDRRKAETSIKLGNGILNYRLEGRPIGDVVRDPDSVYNLPYTQTSLAAGVATYHKEMVNNWIVHLNRK